MKLKRKILYTLLLASFSASAIGSPWPQSAADFAETTNNLPVTVSVLDNDTGDMLTLKESNDWTKNGGRTVIVDNAIKYTSPEGFVGTDTFWYVMADSEGRTNSAKVSVDVTKANVSAWPVSVEDNATTTNNLPVTISVLDNDTGDMLTLKESNDWTQNGGRTVIVDNAIKYTAPEGFVGTDAFWYVMADSEGRTNSAKVSVEVTKATVSAWPVGIEDNVTTTNDVESISIFVLANDVGDDLTITETNSWTRKGGRTSISGNRIKYWPPADFVGDDIFWYVLTDSQGRTNSASVNIKVSDSTKGEKSVVAFCGETYETDGTVAGTSLSLLSPEPTTVTEQPEAVDGVITVDGRTYSIDDSVSPNVLKMTNAAGNTSNVVTASSDTSIDIIGGHTSSSKVFFAVGDKLYSHNGSELATIAEDYYSLIPSDLRISGYVTNRDDYSDSLLETGITRVESATDNFYFKVWGRFSGGQISGHVTLRIDSTTGEVVQVGASSSESASVTTTSTTQDRFYYFNGLDYSRNYEGGSGRGVSSFESSIVQRSNGEVTNTFDDVPPETYAEDRGRFFIITEEVAADTEGNLTNFRIPSKLLTINGDNEFVELQSCAITSAAPQTGDDFAETTKNNSAFITILVLSNDVGDELTLKETNSWTLKGGRAYVNGSVIVYKPATDFVGTDNLWYIVEDAYGRTNSAKVSIEVTE